MHGERLYATLTRLTLRRAVADELMQELFLRLSQSDGFDAASDKAAYAWRAADLKAHGAGEPIVAESMEQELQRFDVTPPGAIP